jgi:hypothetical protein
MSQHRAPRQIRRDARCVSARLRSSVLTVRLSGSDGGGATARGRARARYRYQSWCPPHCPGSPGERPLYSKLASRRIAVVPRCGLHPLTFGHRDTRVGVASSRGWPSRDLVGVDPRPGWPQPVPARSAADRGPVTSRSTVISVTGLRTSCASGTTRAVTAVPCGGLDGCFGWAWRAHRTSVVVKKPETPNGAVLRSAIPIAWSPVITSRSLTVAGDARPATGRRPVQA